MPPTNAEALINGATKKGLRMAYSRRRDKWVSVWIVAAVMAPLIVAGFYVYAAVHFIVKFW